MGARGVRVVAGRYRGLRLTVPAGREVRPTADRVKEAWFSILGERVRDATVVDLFAGSGALGIEALSRGAARVLFVEKARKPLMTLEANLARLEGAADRVRVAAADVFHPHRWVDAGNPPALILADPPYRRNLVAGSWRAWRKRTFRRRRGSWPWNTSAPSGRRIRRGPCGILDTTGRQRYPS